MSARVLPFPVGQNASALRRRNSRAVRRPAERARDLLARGVWREAYLERGKTVIVAVDHTREQIARLAVDGDDSEAAIAAQLEELLNVVSPSARLELVR